MRLKEKNEDGKDPGHLILTYIFLCLYTLVPFYIYLFSAFKQKINKCRKECSLKNEGNKHISF